MRYPGNRGKPPAWRPALWVVLCLLMAAGPAASGTRTNPPDPGLSATLDKDTAKVGERLWLALAYTLPQGARLSDPLQVHGLEDLTLTGRTAGDGEIKIGLLVDRLESFKTGPIGLVYLDPDGKERKIETGPVAVTVRSNLGGKPEDATLRPIQDIIPTRQQWMRYLLWGTAACLLLCAGGGWFWWRRKHRPRTIAGTLVDPPHVKAEKELDGLVADGRLENDPKAFYFLLSEIIRRYMESIRGFPAAEMTTEEIARHIGDDDQDRQVSPLLRQADLVKFADDVPSPARKAADVRTARLYIRQTAPPPVQLPAGAHTPEGRPA